jgi:hypothetical protein
MTSIKGGMTTSTFFVGAGVGVDVLAKIPKKVGVDVGVALGVDVLTKWPTNPGVDVGVAIAGL